MAGLEVGKEQNQCAQTAARSFLAHVDPQRFVRGASAQGGDFYQWLPFA